MNATTPMNIAITTPMTAPTIAIILGSQGAGASVDVLSSAGVLVGLVVCEEEKVEGMKDWKAEGMGTATP